MNIAQNIRRLRIERSVTQEELAAALGVSGQAVSKWECGASLPDTMIFPALADFFRVSTDQLFGYDKRERERAVMGIVDQAVRLRNKEHFTEARAVLEAGLRQYPNDDILLNNILCVIDPKAQPDELLALAQPLIAHTELDDVKYDALRLTAMAWAAKGDAFACAAALEQIPEIYFTKLEWQAKLLGGAAREAAARKQKWLSLECLCDMMQLLGEAETARAVLNLVLEADSAPGKDWRRQQFEEY